MRIGIDLGGTKIEALAIDDAGVEMMRHRVPTPREYGETVAAVAGLVAKLEGGTGQTATVGVGIPGSISKVTGVVKNSNCLWLNGRPFDVDLSKALEREVRVENDANCFAISEATDGAAAGKRVVFGVILGTGCGGGVVVDGRSISGLNGVGGEWGHNPLPWATAEEYPGPMCFCQKHGCLERWISGTGVELDYVTATGINLSAREIVEDFHAGKAEAVSVMERFEDRLTRALAQVINILDPDAIVLGGGLSNFAHLYDTVPKRLAKYVFGNEAATPVLRAVHGDASGVRGAAWLWPNQ
ncbi:MAG TPA: ROK family protein [Acidobacteriaceae bacterium]|nr:ROK family protein [Acidobacteriaceae bacterium]